MATVCRLLLYQFVTKALTGALTLSHPPKWDGSQGVREGPFGLPRKTLAGPWPGTGWCIKDEVSLSAGSLTPDVEYVAAGCSSLTLTLSPPLTLPRTARQVHPPPHAPSIFPRLASGKVSHFLGRSVSVSVLRTLSFQRCTPPVSPGTPCTGRVSVSTPSYSRRMPSLVPCESARPTKFFRRFCDRTGHS